MAIGEENATGDHIETDGRLAVIKLADARSKSTLEETEYCPRNGATVPRCHSC